MQRRIRQRRLFTTDVLTGLKIDQGEFDAALKADNLLSVKDGFNAEALRNAKAASDAALKGDNIRGANSEGEGGHGHGECRQGEHFAGAERIFRFKTKRRCKSISSSRKWRKPSAGTRTTGKRWWTRSTAWRPGIDPTLELASRGRYSGARVNLNPVRDGDVVPANGKIVSAQPGGNLTGTFQRRTGLARRATGQSDRYVLDYHTSMQNTFSKLLEIANKREFDDQLVKSGNAVIDDVGKQVKLANGDVTKAYPLIRKGFVNKNIYVHGNRWRREYAYAANAVLNPWRGGLVEGRRTKRWHRRRCSA